MNGQDSTRFLGAARAAELWIDRSRISTPDGATWRRVPGGDPPEAPTLSSGAPGIIIFYLELARTTGESRFLECACAGADALMSHIDAESEVPAGLCWGLAGWAFCLTEVFRSSGDAKYRDAAVRCVSRIGALRRERGQGIGWLEPIPYPEIFGQTGTTEIYDVAGGAAGVGLGLLYAHVALDHSEALSWAVGIGDRLLEVAEDTPGGLRWQMMAGLPSKWATHPSPNFSHGTAGIAYYLARLADSGRQARFLDAALAGAGHLESITAEIGPGRLVPHEEDTEPPLFYLGWCHGPAGTNRLFFELYRQTGEGHWLDRFEAGGAALLHLGVPDNRTAGYWNTVSQCCGDAGVGDFALDLHQVTGKLEYRQLAIRIGDHLISRAESDGTALCWSQAQHRTNPELCEAQTGYFHGAAGIGSFLLRLQQQETGVRADSISLPDSPF